MVLLISLKALGMRIANAHALMTTVTLTLLQVVSNVEAPF